MPATRVEGILGWLEEKPLIENSYAKLEGQGASAITGGVAVAVLHPRHLRKAEQVVQTTGDKGLWSQTDVRGERM